MQPARRVQGNLIEVVGVDGELMEVTVPVGVAPGDVFVLIRR
jgi:hypothetical protein